MREEIRRNGEVQVSRYKLQEEGSFRIMVRGCKIHSMLPEVYAKSMLPAGFRHFLDCNHVIVCSGSAMLQECGCFVLLGFLYPLSIVVIKMTLSLPNFCHSLIIAAWSVILM